MNNINFNDIDYNKYKDEFLKKLDNVFDEWKDSAYDENFPINSIFFSEAFMVYCLAKEFKIDLSVRDTNPSGKEIVSSSSSTGSKNRLSEKEVIST